MLSPEFVETLVPAGAAATRQPSIPNRSGRDSVLAGFLFLLAWVVAMPPVQEIGIKRLVGEARRWEIRLVGIEFQRAARVGGEMGSFPNVRGGPYAAPAN